MKKIGIIGHGLIGQELNKALKIAGHETIIFDMREVEDNKYFPLDITSDSSFDELMAILKKENITLDAVINSSYPKTTNYGKDLKDVTGANFNETVSLHLGGYFNVMKRFGFFLKEQGRGGAVISFASVYGVVAPRFKIYEGRSFTMPVEYAAVKSGIIHLNKYMAAYFKGTDVRFNILSPGGIMDKHDPSFIEAYGEDTLSSRGGLLDAKDLVGAIKFLVSDDSKYMNGQNVIIDDGWTL